MTMIDTFFIRHRVNTIAELRQVPVNCGVEIDIRTIGEEVILSHDPFSNGERLDTWLKAYRHRLIIVNVKEDGLESRIKDLFERHKVSEYFFLDQSVPSIVRMIGEKEHKMAVRLSEYESVDSVMRFEGKIEWVWVDSFYSFNLRAHDYLRLKAGGFKICLVSPELQPGTTQSISEFVDILGRDSMIPDAVCTKEITRWHSFLNDSVIG